MLRGDAVSRPRARNVMQVIQQRGGNLDDIGRQTIHEVSRVEAGDGSRSGTAPATSSRTT
jgi:hypothetical protein